MIQLSTTLESVTAASSSSTSWFVSLDYISVCINIFGLITNMMVVVTVARNNFLQLKASLLIGHQAAVDILICIVGILNVGFPAVEMYQSSSSTAATFLVCYLWYSQFIFWFLIQVSVLCLALLSVDRYLAVGKPVRYRTLSIRYYLLAHGLAYALAFFLNSMMLFDTVYVERSDPNIPPVCINRATGYGRTLKLFGTAAYQVIGVIWLLCLYYGPCAVMTVFYSFTIYSYRGVAFSTSSGLTESRKLITSQLMKSSIMVTMVFAAAFSMSSVYMSISLFTSGDMRNMSDPVNRVGRVLLNFHSLCPFVYSAMMRSFRVHMLRTLTMGRCNQACISILPIDDSTTGATTVPGGPSVSAAVRGKRSANNSSAGGPRSVTVFSNHAAEPSVA